MTGGTGMILLIGGAVFALILLLANAFGSSKAGDLDRRLARVGGKFVDTPKIEKGRPAQSVRRVTADSNIAVLDRLIKALMPNPDKLRARLGRTGRNITLSEYVLINLILVLMMFLVFNYLAGWPRPASIFLGIAVGLLIPHIVTGIMAGRRMKKFLSAFPEAIDTMCRGLRSGLPISESISAVGREMPDPVGIEFRRISDGVRMGRALEDAMWDVTRRINTPEFRFLIISMAIQKETGGNLAETLDNLSNLIRKRRQLKLKIKAMSSEAKASAMIIGSLPFLMFFILWLVNSDYVMVLFHTIKGRVLLGIGLFWISMGVGVMNKMIRFET